MSPFAESIVLVLRNLLSIFLLPFMIAVVMPAWIVTSWAAVDTRWPTGTALAMVAHIAGALLFLAGFALFAWCVSLFARIGQGTLAPWDPPTKFVAVGPYRHVRNPMISGVLTMLLGEALHLGSRLVAAWALTFLIMNQIHFLLIEEPGLSRLFGASYGKYKASVPRWIPRRSAWNE
ncbi:MAG: isoprenylcysteine carboxylmethyltransferase family protein [Gemmatimonadota bacterium]|nr:isoprenylcysteine carboxylmethyltransferase family protein [Gemmatimonadota bacterium]